MWFRVGFWGVPILLDIHSSNTSFLGGISFCESSTFEPNGLSSFFDITYICHFLTPLIHLPGLLVRMTDTKLGYRVMQSTQSMFSTLVEMSGHVKLLNIVTSRTNFLPSWQWKQQLPQCKDIYLPFSNTFNSSAWTLGAHERHQIGVPRVGVEGGEQIN